MTTELSDLEEGAKILFNDRKTPLTVKEETDEGVIIQGPKGGEYLLYTEDDTLLVCRPGNKKYSSYVEDLREVGEWERNDDTWKHTETGAEIELVKNEIGYWTIESKIELEIELPLYGYSDKEEAVKDVEKVVRKNPEGQI